MALLGLALGQVCLGGASVPLGPGMPRAVEGVLGGLRPGRREGEGPTARERWGRRRGGAAGRRVGRGPPSPLRNPRGGREGGGGVAFRFVGRSHSCIGRAHGLMQ